MGNRRKLKLFISYRRADASGSAGRLFDWLTRQFGRRRIFLDTDKIAAGDRFPEVLAQRIANADVVLAVIGPGWLTIANQDGRRLDQVDDYVRIEISKALESGKRVIPVLVGGAEVPDRAALPPALQGLADRHAMVLRDAFFEQDFDLLIDDLLGRQRGYARTELDRLQRLLLAIKLSSLLVPSLTLLAVLGLWLGLLDKLALGTGVSSHLLALANEVSPPPSDPGVILVAIDPASEQQLQRPFGGSPAWRLDHARLIDRAAAAGARAVVFDLFFEQPTTADASLAAAASRAGESPARTRVVFGVRALTDDQPRLLPVLYEAAAWGSLCLRRPFGHHSYAAPLAVLGDRRLGPASRAAHTPALALAALGGNLQAVDSARRTILTTDPANQVGAPRFSQIRRIRGSWGNCATLADGDDVAMLLIQPAPDGYWGQPARRISYADAVHGDGRSTQALRDRILLVGVTLPGLDQYPVVSGFLRRQSFGVELHADAIAALRNGREIVTPSVDRGAIILLLMVSTGASIGFLTATWARARRSFALGSLALTYLLIALGLASQGLLLNLVYDATAFLVAYAVLRRLRTGGFTSKASTLTEACE